MTFESIAGAEDFIVRGQFLDLDRAVEGILEFLGQQGFSVLLATSSWRFEIADRYVEISRAGGCFR